ncbi:MAG TPA: DNA polymerase/3'-5' exonuclease PolX [Actinocrinis sp.]|nr:DNA polymerase/3'-5' exonuclease PolX [Actinocrinis sp.]
MIAVARSNDEVEAALVEYADLLTITGGDLFKIRAYERAARAVAGYRGDVGSLDAKSLQKLPGIGRSIAEKIVEFCHTGTIQALEEQRAEIPAGVRQMVDIPTLGPKKALALHRELGVASIEELVDAIQAGRLDGLRGFGPKTGENILRGVALLQQSEGRVQLDVAAAVAERILGELSAVVGCERCTYAGSLRRFRETVGDIDILAASSDPVPIMRALTKLPDAAEVIARGEKKTSIRTASGLQVDLRVIPPQLWGAALQYFTGSKAHNVRVREIAVRAGFKLSEYGLFEAESGKLIVSETEEELYPRLGMAWVPPPLREDRGEIEAARDGTLPDLVTEADIRGDLHTHTNLTDGVSSLEDMVRAAAARGYSYYAITDHAPNLVMQRMTDEKILAQRGQVRQLDSKYRRMTLLHGAELNIDPDGEVDWPEDFLAGFDVCVASVHSHFNLSRAQMTRRLVRACENPQVNVIGHPTTRMLGHRAGVDADWDEVFRAAARTGTALEVNGLPDRIDLRDEDILAARRFGVKFAIDSDAHSTANLGLIRYGVGTAQRGWLTRADVINTWPLRDLRTFLRKESGRSSRQTA